MRDEPLATHAHDLRTPLSVIRGYAELLAVRDDDQTRVEAAAFILEAAHRLSDFIDEALPPPADDGGPSAVIATGRRRPTP